MTPTYAICITVILIVAMPLIGWMRFMRILDRAVKEFDLDCVKYTGRTVEVQGRMRMATKNTKRILSCRLISRLCGGKC